MIVLFFPKTQQSVFRDAFYYFWENEPAFLFYFGVYEDFKKMQLCS
jgi:hypothetical protein